MTRPAWHQSWRNPIGPLALAVTLAAGGCSAERGTTVALAERSVADIPPLTTFAYSCDDGTAVVANHRAEGDVYLFLPRETILLPQVESASGARYDDGTTSYWSKDREAIIQRADGTTARCQEQRRRSIIEDAKLRGADYWATGNEPGWTLEITGDSIRFVTGYATEHYRFATPDAAIVAGEQRVTYHASADDHALTVTIVYGRCRDSMSDEEFESAVALMLDDAVLLGCGRALH